MSALDLDTLDALADRIAQRLDLDTLADLIADRLRDDNPPTAGQLVDATTLARLLGISRTTVYERADELGAVRIGNGPRPRLRFDPARAREAVDATPPSPPPAPSPALRPRRPRGRRAHVLTPKGEERTT